MALAMCLLFSVVLSMGVVAATTPWVEGVVTEEGTSNVLPGATVTATCNGISSEPVTTNVDGIYLIYLPGCRKGIVYVEATYNGNTGSGEGRMTSDRSTRDYSATVNLAYVMRISQNSPQSQYQLQQYSDWCSSSTTASAGKNKVKIAWNCISPIPHF